jgi:cell division protein FtsQ
MMHQRKSKKLLVYFFLLITVSSISNNSINNLKLNKIKNIKISGLDQKENKIFLDTIKDLNLENIFFINKNEIIKLINSNSLIENYEVTKKYPSTINIKIKKTSFFAKINNNGKIFLIGSNGKLTLATSDNPELPFIFGKTNIKEFLKFKRIIDNSKFSYNQIENLFFFPSKRWDIKFEDELLLKLPINPSKETLDLLYEFLESYTGEKLISVDARIENQIVLNG